MLDNCPFTFNPDQADVEGDGLGDACDLDDDNDGCLDSMDDLPNDPSDCVDTDGDQVGDTTDNCPATPNPDQANADNANDGGDACDTNDDNDAYLDADDVDDDGDGLIEIYTAADLDAIRHNLQGTGIVATSGASANSTGCGGQNNLSSCSGYELRADISLADYDSWSPIGNCASTTASCGVSNSFTGTLDGNGFSITNMTISLTGIRVGVGLFNAISGSATIHDLRLGDISISSNAAGFNIGALAGTAADSIISRVSVENVDIRAPFSTLAGGLLGFGRDMNISAVSVVSSNIVVEIGAGGLVGELRAGSIKGVSVVAGSIRAPNSGWSGGLAGVIEDATVSSTYVAVGAMRGYGRLGGVFGSAQGGSVNTTISILSQISGVTRNIGPFQGFVNDRPLVITNSYRRSGVRYPDAFPNPQSDDAVYKSSTVLRAPTAPTGIYESWADIWCDPATGELTTDPTHELALAGGGDTYRAWDFGTSSQYPALKCFHKAPGPDLRQDADEDGWINLLDPVPNSSPADVSSGDADGDGYFGSEDIFPNDWTEFQDSDGDLVGDNSDNCPHTHNNFQTDSDGDGIGDACDLD